MVTKKFEIKSPCGINWEEMKAEKDGNFCDSCNTIVADYTNYSDEELIQALRSKKHHCCSVHPEQLGRLSVSKTAHKERSKYWMAIAASIVAGVLQVSTSYAQSPDTKSIYKIGPNDLKRTQQTQKISKITIQVIDGRSKKPVQNARVYITQTDKAVLTDSTGMASIEMRELLKINTYNLIVTKNVSKRKFVKKYKEELSLSINENLTDVIIVKLNSFTRGKLYRVMGCPSF